MCVGAFGMYGYGSILLHMVICVIDVYTHIPAYTVRPLRNAQGTK